MRQPYGVSLTKRERLLTRRAQAGDLIIGDRTPIKIQTMTTTDTMDTEATVAQSIRCIQAGAELIRIAAPSKKEAENLKNIKTALRQKGYTVPLAADIHYTPNAAEIAAEIVEKVRINPGNYIDKKRFEYVEYSDKAYKEELEKIYRRFLPLLVICKKNGVALRIGANHGSLSDRIMSRYGDTPIGMVESAMEFLRMARMENFHNIVVSMKASATQVAAHAYRLSVHQMMEEFGECYPLHLGVTEAGDGEDGRIKSAIGIGALLEDGIGDTIRVSLTEDPEYEIPVCKKLIAITGKAKQASIPPIPPATGEIFYSPFSYTRNASRLVGNIGGGQTPVVISDMSRLHSLDRRRIESIGYFYQENIDKWNIADTAPEYIYIKNKKDIPLLPPSLKVIIDMEYWNLSNGDHFIPLFTYDRYVSAAEKRHDINMVKIDCFSSNGDIPDFSPIENDPSAVLFLYSERSDSVQSIRRMLMALKEQSISAPIVIMARGEDKKDKEYLQLQYAAQVGSLFIDGWGDGIYLRASELLRPAIEEEEKAEPFVESLINGIAFGILQGVRARISKTEYISCPSCGRTLFDLQSTTERVRSATNHLKGLKIAVMGCIVNGPGEMADADFGYVGSGVGKITLYKGKEVVKKNIASDIAVEELVRLIKKSGNWADK